MALAYVLVAVMVFTTPWDNLAAKWGIWGFPPDKYLRKIGYLPVEEYAFFLLQSLNVILLLRVFFRFFPDWRLEDETNLNWIMVGCVVISLPILLGLGWQLRVWRQRLGPCVNYANHLAWFLPVIYLQWVLAPYLFWHHLGLLGLVTGIFGIYYTLADLVAVRYGTWFFDERQISGWKLAGILPWEEIAFFFLTSLLVAQSYLLLVPAISR